jgi:hypothetical protein
MAGSKEGGSTLEGVIFQSHLTVISYQFKTLSIPITVAVETEKQN